MLGIDYGERRIGLALSDPLRIIATPFDVLERTDLASDLASIAKVIDDEDVHELVVGQPNNTDGTRSDMVARVESFVAKLLEVRSLPVHWVDESFTSLEAEELLRAESRDWRVRKRRIDKVAAQIILRTWLDRQ